MVHNIYRLALDDKLALAPLRSPEFALDSESYQTRSNMRRANGYSVGSWHRDRPMGLAIWSVFHVRCLSCPQMNKILTSIPAEENPNCQVIGTDLSLIQPLSWMPNCRFVQQNSELHDWVFPNQFDYIHLRGMLACFNDVRAVMRRAFDGLAVGGWIEFQDPGWSCCGLPGKDGRSSLEGTGMERWLQLVRKGAKARGRDLAKASLYRQQLVDLGFLDVHEKLIHAPIGPWAKGDRSKLLGVYMANAFHTGSVDSFKPFLAAAGELSESQVEELTEQVKAEILSCTKKRWYMTM